MSKHRHTKDKMHITYSQLKQQRQLKKDNRKIPFSKLPFYCCALSLAPFQNPVCTPQGNVFDIVYVMPFIKKYQRNPINGKPLKTSELIKMIWTKNDKNEYQDPISYKVFTQYTHIVCIRTTGYVYAYDTVNQLNKKPKFYYDLVTNIPFQLSDIITIQDPKNLENRQLREFDYLKNNLSFIISQKPQRGQNESVNKIMEEVENLKKQKQQKAQQQINLKNKQKQLLESKQDMKSFIKWCFDNKMYKHQRQTDYRSASLTSTNFTPSTKNFIQYRQLKQTEIREKVYNIIRKQKLKGFVQICTNLGNFNVIIHADLVPKTSQNFIQLTQSGYYDNNQFHRLVKDFCLQGGDPTSTGNGGQSLFGRPFNDEFHQKLNHSKPLMLSMANSGPNTNRSQFFITLSSAPFLDNKHSVFGQVISNEQLFYQINKNLTSKSNKPKSKITIQKMYCYDNPFRKTIKKMKQQNDQEPLNSEQLKQKQKQRWIEGVTQKFTLPNKNNIKSPNNQSTLSKKLLKDYL